MLGHQLSRIQGLVRDFRRNRQHVVFIESHLSEKRVTDSRDHLLASYAQWPDFSRNPFMGVITGQIHVVFSFLYISVFPGFIHPKEIVSRDFLTLFFFIIHLLLGHWFTPWNIFENGGEFAEILEFQIADDAAELWFSWVTGTAESKLSGVIDTAESVKIKFCIWYWVMTQWRHWHHWVQT